MTRDGAASRIGTTVVGMTSTDTTSTLSPLGRLRLGRLHPSPEAMLTIGAHGPLDDRGQLVHAEDPAAQLALALAGVEATLAGVGFVPADLAQLRVSATDLAAVLSPWSRIAFGAVAALVVTGTVQAVDGQLVIEPETVDLDGPDWLDSAASALVRELVTIRHTVEGVPEGMALTSVAVQEGGFRAHLRGDDVALAPAAPVPAG